MTRARSWREWEEWSLDEFFLKPGQKGPIEFVDVCDQDVLNFLGTDDIELAGRIFSRCLGAQSIVRDLLSDSSPLHPGREPPSIRLLVFVFWAQVTSLLPAVEHDFRDILTFRLGWTAPGTLTGLRRLLEHLSGWLKDRHNVELRLPDGKYVQIGYASRLAFPTWRDLGFLRSVRDGLAASFLSEPRVVADRIRTLGLDARSPAFRSLFGDWHLSARVSDPFISDRAFDRAWTRVVSEVIGSADLCVSRDEFGRFTMEIIEQGRSRPLAAIADAEIDKLKPGVGHLVRAGAVHLAPIGFGRWLATEDSCTDAVLHRGRQLAGLGAHSPAGPSIRVGSTGWVYQQVCPDIRAVAAVAAAGTTLVRRKDGIRVGAALLGRAPMTPEWLLAGPCSPVLTLDGVELPSRGEDGVVRFLPGTWSGQVHLLEGSKSLDGFRLVPDAIEHQAAALKAFDVSFALPEDGELRDTEPDRVGKTMRYEGVRVPRCEGMRALEEAVYARSGRTIAMRDIVGLAHRAVDGGEGPSPWDIVRSFVDGGWLEPAAVRAASGHLFVPRPLRLLPRFDGGREVFILDGMAAEAVRMRVRACADVVGVECEEMPGLGSWTLPTTVLRPARTHDLDRFLDRSGLMVTRAEATLSPRSRQWHSRASSATGYVEASTWDAERGRFIDGAVSGAGLSLRIFDRPTLDQPSIYVLDASGGREIFRSAVLAFLRHSEISGRPAYRRAGPTLVRAHPRALLPAAWGRWLSRRALACAGPVRTRLGWTYAYPVDDRAQRALMRACRFIQGGTLPSWCKAVDASRRDDVPNAMVAGRLLRSRSGMVTRRSP